MYIYLRARSFHDVIIDCDVKKLRKWLLCFILLPKPVKSGWAARFQTLSCFFKPDRDWKIKYNIIQYNTAQHNTTQRWLCGVVLWWFLREPEVKQRWARLVHGWVTVHDRSRFVAQWGVVMPPENRYRMTPGVRHSGIVNWLIYLFNTTKHNKTKHNKTQHNKTQHNTTKQNKTQPNTTQPNTTQHNTT